MNLQKVSDYKINQWLENNIRELTKYQKECIRDEEIVRFAPFEFYEPKKKTNSVILRLSIILMPFVFIILMIGLPFNFIITGRWGYKYEKIKWYSDWCHKCGL